MKENILPQLSPYLFWDCHQDRVDPDADRKLILERVFSRGTENDERLVYGYYGKEEIKRTVVEIKYLDIKVLNYLSVMLDIPREKFKCYEKSLSPNPFGICREERPMLIRHAEMKDYLWLAEQDKYISADILKNKINLMEVYVIQENNELIGWLRYNLFWDNIPFMNMIYLLDAHRNKGFGKKLVFYWENEMKKNGFDNVLTSTLSSEDAQHFYRKIGYKEIGGFNYLDEPLEILFHKKI